jgi:hypothetical protein
MGIISPPPCNLSPTQQILVSFCCIYNAQFKTDTSKSHIKTTDYSQVPLIPLCWPHMCRIVCTCERQNEHHAILLHQLLLVIVHKEMVQQEGKKNSCYTKSISSCLSIFGLMVEYDLFHHLRCFPVPKICSWHSR